MTWVVGVGGFNAAMIVADMRMSIKPGGSKRKAVTTAAIQKTYELGPNLAVGFAGHVFCGLAMVDRMRAQILADFGGFVPGGAIAEPTLYVDRLVEELEATAQRCPRTAREPCRETCLMFVWVCPRQSESPFAFGFSRIVRFPLDPETPSERWFDRDMIRWIGSGGRRYGEAMKQWVEMNGFSRDNPPRSPKRAYRRELLRRHGFVKTSSEQGIPGGNRLVECLLRFNTDAAPHGTTVLAHFLSEIVKNAPSEDVGPEFRVGLVWQSGFYFSEHERRLPTIRTSDEYQGWEQSQALADCEVLA